MAERIIESMQTPLLIEEQELVMSFSIGISLFPDDGGDPETLIKNADTAMYQIKGLGRNGFECYSAT